MEDSEIIDLYWERSERAVEVSIEKYGAYCGKIAWNVLSSKEDAEECVNDAFLAAWNAIPPQKPSHLPAFLGSITRNIALNRYDYRKAKKRNTEFDLLLSELEECIPSGSTVEGVRENKEIAMVISRFLREAESLERKLFLRRYWYSDSIAEAAKRFHISESKTKSILFRMRGKLKIYLEKEGIAL